MLRAQYRDFIDSGYQSSKDTYIVCPGTTIAVDDLRHWDHDTGFPPDHLLEMDDHEDMPLIVPISNTTIRCGKSQEDILEWGPCTLTDGIAQVWIQNRHHTKDHHYSSSHEYLRDYAASIGTLIDPSITFEQWTKIHELSFWTDSSLDNVTIRDFVFTGSIDQHSNLLGMSGKSVVIENRPGNVTFENCVWEDMTALSGVLFLNYYSTTIVRTNTSSDDDEYWASWGLGSSIMAQHAPPSLSLSSSSPNNGLTLTIINCTFRDIIHHDPLFSVHGNTNNATTMIIRDTNFSKIIPEVPLDHVSCHDSQYSGRDESRCPYLIACEDWASCLIEDSCRDNSTQVVEEFGLDEIAYDWLYRSENAIISIDTKSQECGFH